MRRGLLSTDIREQLAEVFLATLDEIAEAPHYSGGKPGKPTLDDDTVMSILLEQIDNWHDVPYATIRGMFEALLKVVPMDDVERLVARVSNELVLAEECAAEDAAEEREAIAIEHARKAVNALANEPDMLRHFVAAVRDVAQLLLDEQNAAVQ